jgi:hypothetical protein
MAQRSYSNILRELNSKTEQVESLRSEKKKRRDNNKKLREQNEKTKKIDGKPLYTKFDASLRVFRRDLGLR